ncbi:hypothetical protein [Chryseobacterium wanjuense]
MKKAIVLFLWFSVTKAQTGSVGIGTSTPDPSTILEVKASNKGMQLPIVSLTSTIDITTIPNPKTSFIIYNNSNASSGNTAVTRGSTLTMERCGKKCGLNKK